MKILRNFEVLVVQPTFLVRMALPSSFQVHNIHHIMAVLLFFKTLSLLFEAVRFHYYAKNGYAEGWSIVYYIFAFVKGVMRFVVILLIGTGWSLLKPYLSDREKKIVLVVLVLQVRIDRDLVNTDYCTEELQTYEALESADRESKVP